MQVRCPLWLPLDLSRQLGAAPIPMFTWFAWHYANATTFAHSRTATDPFPDGVTA